MALGAIKSGFANAATRIKNIPTKKKIAVAAGAAAVVGSAVLAYKKGKIGQAEMNLEGLKGVRKFAKTLQIGYAEIGRAIADKAIDAKNAVVKFFKKA